MSKRPALRTIGVRPLGQAERFLSRWTETCPWACTRRRSTSVHVPAARSRRGRGGVRGVRARELAETEPDSGGCTTRRSVASSAPSRSSREPRQPSPSAPGWRRSRRASSPRGPTRSTSSRCGRSTAARTRCSPPGCSAWTCRGRARAPSAARCIRRLRWCSWRHLRTRAGSSTSPRGHAAEGIPALVDNTRDVEPAEPARHGASLVVHSATKYPRPRHVVGGVVATSEAWRAAGRVRILTGALMHPSLHISRACCRLADARGRRRSAQER
jgi:hypothetical protein